MPKGRSPPRRIKGVSSGQKTRTVVIVSSRPAVSPSWAGASVYQAYSSGGSYSLKTRNAGSGVIGTVSAVGDDSGTKYITVVLDTDYTLSTSNPTDMAANIFKNLFYADGVAYGRFETVELTGVNTWKLTDLTYDPPDTNVSNSYGSIDVADVLVFYAGTMNSIVLISSETGMSLYYKTPSFNMVGVENTMAGLTPVEVVV